ncbi:MAG: hypothetical protein M8467_11615, partial [Anaerolineae bacterium]|nr:hypothetical protein [Anaerolineae bacterium]
WRLDDAISRVLMHTSKVVLTLRDWNLGGWHFSARTGVQVALWQPHLHQLPNHNVAHKRETRHGISPKVHCQRPFEFTG